MTVTNISSNFGGFWCRPPLIIILPELKKSTTQAIRLKNECDEGKFFIKIKISDV